ncbi:hypothetical protein D9M73_264310 [compost metagenome]
MILDLLAEPGMIDHQFANAGLRQRPQMELDERRVGGAYQRLRGMQGQGAHALALARRENHGLHWAMASSRGRLESSSPSSASSGRRLITASI